ncbi:MAG: DNA mismatch repair protein MutS [Duganella sp.]
MHLFAVLTRLLLPAPAALTDQPFTASEVAHYQRLLQPQQDGAATLDAQTWSDLMLTQYSARLAPGISILGQQELQRRLYALCRIVDAATTHTQQQVRTLVADAPQRQRLQTACQGLRAAEHEVSEVLFGAPLAPSPRWARCLPLLPLALLAAIVLALSSGVAALWLLVLVLLAVLMTLQVRFHYAASTWQRGLDTLSHMLRAHVLLAGLDDAPAAVLRSDAGAAGKLNRRLMRSPLLSMPGMSEYADWLLLFSIRHYFFTQGIVRDQLPLLRASFQRVAGIEADLALARHLADAPRYCWAERGDTVLLEQAVHPLLAEPAPLSLRLDATLQGAFISGQNGVGKSTLLRTVGLNLVLARAFGFCYANAAVTPGLPVYASMQNEDALESGESLYVAEVRRAGELLALAQQAPAIFIIDEIFRGTNHLESVSAAAAVIDTLAAGSRVLVSSHNLILAPLLSKRLAPLCVERSGGQLRLVSGILKETNGISMLNTIDPSGLLSGKANEVRTQLGAYYRSYPGDLDTVLE